MISVLWLRRDLRLHDHPALLAAVAQGAVLPLVVLDDALLGDGTRPRDAVYLRAVTALQEATDGALVVRRGAPEQAVAQVCAEAGARTVHVSAESTPYGRRRDELVRARLESDGIEWVATGSPYAIGPGLIRTGAGAPYQVFTPFSRAWREHGWPAPADRPAGVRWHQGTASEDLPEPADPVALENTPVTEDEARAAWADFLDGPVATYGEDRNRPDLAGTSRLSTALKLGTIHPRTMLHDLAGATAGTTSAAKRFATELAWREFYADVLWHRPETAWRDLRSELAGMTYDDPESDPQAAEHLEAWCAGRTGYPIVDAGMRQLLAEGWMHNRVRMLTASFLTKDLHIWWPHGARHFLDHLTDGDLASNSHGWQWVAGTGTDAAPYFRIFNPTLQGRKFDPDGDYVRQYVPELGHLTGTAAHEPWKHPGGYEHGYPEPIIDHADERAVALDRYAAARDAQDRS